jgi:hypothetical protein
MEQFEPRTEPQPDPWPIARAALIDVFETWQNREKTATRERARQ